MNKKISIFEIRSREERINRELLEEYQNEHPAYNSGMYNETLIPHISIVAARF